MYLIYTYIYNFIRNFIQISHILMVRNGQKFEHGAFKLRDKINICGKNVTA